MSAAGCCKDRGADIIDLKFLKSSQVRPAETSDQDVENLSDHVNVEVKVEVREDSIHRLELRVESKEKASTDGGAEASTDDGAAPEVAAA